MGRWHEVSIGRQVEDHGERTSTLVYFDFALTSIRKCGDGRRRRKAVDGPEIIEQEAYCGVEN